MSEDEHHHDEDLTTSTMERWEYIGTILAAAIVLSYVGIMVGAGLGVVVLANISQAWFLLYATVVLMAVTWAFGHKTLEAVKKARDKNE